MIEKKISFKMLEKKMANEGVLIIVVPKVGYAKRLVKIVKIVEKQNEKICYVSANKPRKSLIETFASEGIDRKRILVVDCIAGEFGEEGGVAGETIFISTPKDLTRLSLVIGEVIKSDSDIVFVDSLSTFMLYNPGLTVVRFVHNLISKIRVLEKRGVFIVLKDDASSDLLNDLCLFVDDVVEIGGAD
ncbi:hypothetical protein J4226_05045 [Candidatus Pacearchaeota archaeon]|nr:hypothetical protein [Candidatus Pacearchaeota archaeon]